MSSSLLEVPDSKCSLTSQLISFKIVFPRKQNKLINLFFTKGNIAMSLLNKANHS